MHPGFTIEINHTVGLGGAPLLYVFHTIKKKIVARKGIEIALG